MLITLFLDEKKILSQETLYVSYFLKRNRVISNAVKKLIELNILKQTKGAQREFLHMKNICKL